MSEKTIIEKKPKIYWWYASLVEFHDFESFKVGQLQKLYNINACHIPSYKEFINTIENERQKEINKINEYNKEKNNFPPWINIIINDNPILFDKINQYIKSYSYLSINFYDYETHYDFCIKIIKNVWQMENSLSY